MEEVKSSPNNPASSPSRFFLPLPHPVTFFNPSLFVSLRFYFVLIATPLLFRSFSLLFPGYCTTPPSRIDERITATGRRGLTFIVRDNLRGRECGREPTPYVDTFSLHARFSDDRGERENDLTGIVTLESLPLKALRTSTTRLERGDGGEVGETMREVGANQRHREERKFVLYRSENIGREKEWRGGKKKERERAGKGRGAGRLVRERQERAPNSQVQIEHVSSTPLLSSPSPSPARQEDTLYGWISGKVFPDAISTLLRFTFRSAEKEERGEQED